MFNKTMMTAAIVAALATPGMVLAAEAESPHTFTANVGLFSQYIFRGMNQTTGNPAGQGGFDYAYNFGPASVYVGTWNSNISWLTDGGQYTSSSLESDWYGGVKGNFGKSDFTYDLGFLYYYYPGNINTLAAGASGDTAEVYGALGWKWLSVKYSHVVSNKAFAILDAQGTYYVDLSASVPIGETGLTLLGHYGIQKFDGTDLRTAAVGSNDTIYSYNDWKIGATYDLGKLSKVLNATTLGAYYTDTSGATAAGWGGRGEGGVYPKTISGNNFTVYLQKTF